ncbi:PDR/VanB family oxidoreductase [Nocardioides daejeonensis]|uniref:PDR/VanB family oxidoreductase n=1 Tax=Nocardioides daejeonensis TaxID=1046556 RepID=UPI000D747F95|nr:PDR/VanB family oxidoreductase [Nocardioides daejeonensis]
MSTVSLVRDVRVTGCDQIAAGVRRLRLEARDGAALPAWEPGAHLDLLLPSGLVRQYSLCGPVGTTGEYEIAVLCEAAGRGGSVEVHGALAVGDELRIAGPRNRFPLVPSPRYVFVAGGIGITPILPMIEEAERAGAAWRLVYGGRSRSTMAYLDRLDRYGERVLLQPQDEFGLLDLEELLRPEPDTLVYCCGPEPLIAAVEQRCARDWPPQTLHTERFIASDGVAVVDEGSTSFEVQLGIEGPVLDVPADKSILAVLLEADVDVLYSCEEGTCGSCETQVLAGTPAHRDHLLSDESREQGCMLICVSRCLGDRLVLDVDVPDELAASKRDSA